MSGLSPSLRVTLRRLLLALPLLFVVSVLSFAIISATPSEFKNLRRHAELGQPVYEQYGSWLRGAVQGDLGRSFTSKQSVSEVVTGTRMSVTLSLLLGALVFSIVFGVGLGMLGAIRGGAVGRGVDALSVSGYAIPSFWLGAVLISIFAVRFRVLPATGYVRLSEDPTEWTRSLILPWIALSVGPIAAVARYTREAMLDALASEHVRMLWANGISARSIYFRHALKNAAPQIVTVLGLVVVGLLTGAVLIEAVFALPGLGQLAVISSNSHDVPMIQGIVVLFTVVVIVVNLFVDLASTWLNPRVTTS